MSPDDAVFGDRARLAQKLEDVKTERDQLLYQNQLLATDLKGMADLVRGYCEERDEAETEADNLAWQLADAKARIQDLESALCVAVSDGDTAPTAWPLSKTIVRDGVIYFGTEDGSTNPYLAAGESS